MVPAVSASEIGSLSCNKMLPVSMAAFNLKVVTPVSFSPLITAQLISAYAYTFNSYALLTLIWLPLTIKNCRLVLQRVTGAALIPLLVSTARLQLLLSFTLGLALFI